MIRPAKTRYASRYLLPVEIFAAVVLLSWGICGSITPGALAGLLETVGISTPWGITLSAVALAQLSVAVVEAALGRRWPDDLLLYSVSARCGLAFVAFPVWLYMFKIGISTPGASFVSLLVIQAPIGALTNGAIFALNLRARCLLHPRIECRELERRVRLDRQRLAR